MVGEFRVENGGLNHFSGCKDFVIGALVGEIDPLDILTGLPVVPVGLLGVVIGLLVLSFGSLKKTIGSLVLPFGLLGEVIGFLFMPFGLLDEVIGLLVIMIGFCQMVPTMVLEPNFNKIDGENDDSTNNCSARSSTCCGYQFPQK